jgi:hypothetical protein
MVQRKFPTGDEMQPIVIQGQYGLGDNVYARPFIRSIARRRAVYLETPWPELYSDLPVRFIKGHRSLRTQAANILRQPKQLWSVAPPGTARMQLGYGSADLEIRGIIRTLERKIPLAIDEPLDMDLPDMGQSPVIADKPIAVVRPVTVRTDWRNEARNPLPEYVMRAADTLFDTHHVVVVASLAPGQEWLVAGTPSHDVAFLKGELDVKRLMALCRAADVLVGGVGWIVPVALALRKKAFIVLGGHGAHNSPKVITDPRLDLSRIGFATPERFCRCSNMMHRRCDKTIRTIDEQWHRWATSNDLRCSTFSP